MITHTFSTCILKFSAFSNFFLCILFSWNVRTLNQGGKLENLKTEMQKNDVSVLGVSEVRWKGQGEIRSGDYTVYYSGGERAERG